MQDSDRIYFSDFAVDPEFESRYDYDDLYDMDFETEPEQLLEADDYDASDQFHWDSIWPNDDRKNRN